MRPLVIYHGPGCMDGAGAALAAWLKFGDGADYRPAQYGDQPPTDDDVRGRDVYVLDFSYPRAELERMHAVQRAASGTFERAGAYENGGTLVVIDHHKTAQTDLDGLSYCTFDMKKSGAVLAWERFHATPVPELFAYIEDRDLWRWKLTQSKAVSAALASTGAATDFRKLAPYFAHWHTLGSGYSIRQLFDEGAAILRAEAQLVDRAVASAENVSISGVPCLAVSSPLLQSEIGEALALESARRSGSAIGVVYYRDGKAGKWRVGLRSRDVRRTTDAVDLLVAEAPDVSSIAKSFGGGGHRRAAGFECDQLPWVAR